MKTLYALLLIIFSTCVSAWNVGPTNSIKPFKLADGNTYTVALLLDDDSYTLGIFKLQPTGEWFAAPNGIVQYGITSDWITQQTGTVYAFMAQYRVVINARLKDIVDASIPKPSGTDKAVNMQYDLAVGDWVYNPTNGTVDFARDPPLSHSR